MVKIVILGEIHFPNQELESFLNKYPDTKRIKVEEINQKELAQKTGDAEAVLVSPMQKLTEEYFVNCKSLQYLGICGTSLENVDLKAALASGVAVTNVRDYGDEPTAEFIFMQLTSLLRGVHGLQWRDAPHELMGKSIGIIGMGALGKTIADLALAYKMHARYNSRSRHEEYDKKGVGYAKFTFILQTSDIVVVCTPSNLEVLDYGSFEDLKEGAILVQASMGSALSRSGFLKWIEKEANFAIFDYAAGEDNYETYSHLPRVIFPKIVAGHSSETKQRLAGTVLRQIVDFFNTHK